MGPKRQRNRANKINLVFDEAKRRDFLTGFHKRKLQRQKQAREKLETELKEERKRLKAEAKDSYKKLVVSCRDIPELEQLVSEEYDDGDVSVKVVELSTNAIAAQNNWIGANRPKYEENASESENEDEEENNEKLDEIPGMELKPKRKSLKKVQEKEKVEFDSEKDVKKALKKKATKNVQKSRVFQMKNKLERQKQKKKSLQAKKQRIKFQEKKTKRKNNNNRKS